MATTETELCRRVLDVLAVHELAAQGVPMHDHEALKRWLAVERGRVEQVDDHAPQKRGRRPLGIGKRALMTVAFDRAVAAGATSEAAAAAVVQLLGVAYTSVKPSATALWSLLWDTPEAAALAPTARLDFVDQQVRAWRALALATLEAEERHLAAEAEKTIRTRRAARHGLENSAFSHR